MYPRAECTCTQVTGNGIISLDEWYRHFRNTKQEEGADMVAWLLALFERRNLVQVMIRTTIAESEELHKLLR